MVLVCEPGERVTEAFERFENDLKKYDWHLLSTEVGRLYLIFLLDTQQSINIQCFGGILCTRDTLKKVINLQTVSSSIGILI